MNQYRNSRPIESAFHAYRADGDAVRCEVEVAFAGGGVGACRRHMDDETHTGHPAIEVAIDERDPASVVLNETVTSVPDYDGHWRGQAYITHHTYGEQVHRYSGDAERWNRTQANLLPAPIGATCPDCDNVPDSSAALGIDEQRRRVEWSSGAAVFGER